MGIETRWWHRQDDKVVCTLCPRECHIPLGSRGFCFVRANVDGQLELTTYGRSSGFCVDPIEKKPLNHFLPGTPVLSFGTAGCNLGCKFCQNWDISKSREMDRLADQATPEAIIQAAKQAGCHSVAFTYNDPIIWAEYAIDIAKVARREGIKTVAVTAGYISPRAREEFCQWMDAANVDLKAFTESFYRRLTQTHLQPVLDTLKYLKHHTDVWFEITNLMIPTQNDSPDEVQQMCDWIVDNLGDQVPIHFTAFHPDFKMRDLPRTPAETLLRAREQALAAGIKYAYVGNVDDATHQTTYCAGCGNTVIERNWYQLGAYNLDGNRCRACGHHVPGVFDAQPGTWGRKRLPLRILNQPETETTSMPTPETQSSSNPLSTSEPVRVSANTTRTASADDPSARSTPKIDFSPEQSTAILEYARETARAAVTGSKVPEALPAEIADAPAYGLFVTLKRKQSLRACRGRWGGSSLQVESPFGQLLQQVAHDTATMDPRFPSITPEEIDLLHIEVSVMHSPSFIDVSGHERAEHVEVGKHGLVLLHEKSQGLLLPQVATEAGWDSATFLDNVCRKANLPHGTWYEDPNAKVMTFQANVLSADSLQHEPHPPALPSDVRARFIDVANQMLTGQIPAVADDTVLTTIHVQDLGLYLHTTTGLSAATVGPNHSLLELAKLATDSIRQFAAQRSCDAGRISRVTLLYQPIRLCERDYPNRHRYLAASAAVIRHQGRHAVSLPDKRTRRDPIAHALTTLRIDPRQWPDANDPSTNFRATAFSVFAFAAPAPAARPVLKSIPRKPLPARPAAQAGRFYPNDPSKMREQIDQHLAAATKNHAGNSRTFRAVMLPHAGWDYCGETLGKTLARVDVPATAIILGPKHTFEGPVLSVAPHASWAIPGSSVPIDTKLVDKLVLSIDGLQPEPDAHRTEHGSEVLLPFLQRLRPDIRVTPIVVGNIGYDATINLGRQLAGVLTELDRPPLLVISSDLNHFATQQENERRDRLALDAMKTADPKTLYNTCRDHDISMCGLLPAVAITEALNTAGPTQIEIVDYSNSATKTGDANRVVGYGGALLT